MGDEVELPDTILPLDHALLRLAISEEDAARHRRILSDRDYEAALSRLKQRLVETECKYKFCFIDGDEVLSDGNIKRALTH